MGHGEVGVEEGLEQLKGGLGAGVEEAVVAYAVKAGGQDMQEVAADELDACEADMAGALVLTVFEGDEDRMSVDGEDAPVGDDTFMDVLAEILDGVFAGADGFYVHHPVDPP